MGVDAETAEHADLEAWARKFGGTAILGFISTLLLAGKFLHHITQRRGLVCGLVVVPPALLSGLVGLIWFSGLEYLDPILTTDMRLGLEALKSNLINFVFAALILGITCGRANSQHNSSFRGIVTSLFHEGMPMVIYSQLLTWGQTTCCLLLVCIGNTFFGAKIPRDFAAMVPLGLEAGSDITVSANYKSDWTDTIVEESESLGLLVICILGVVLFTLKPYFLSQGWLGKDYHREQLASGAASLHLQHGTGQAEAFLRATSRHGHSHGVGGGVSGSGGGARHALLTASRSFSNFGQLTNSGSVPNTPGIELEQPSPGSPRDKKTFSFDDDMNDLILVKEEGKSVNASLGAHLALIALTAFLSFGVSLSMHLIEIQLHIEDHWLSGVRMFKLTMCCAMLCMVFVVQRASVRFNRDWFMHMCGLMLDLLVIAALTKAHPKPRALQQTHYLECGVFVLLCVLWNIFCFVFVARRLFPNYWFERAVTLAGDTMGHSFTGLLFVRTLDPAMESPVPAAYAYKLLLFFIPSSGAKQTIIMSTMKEQGAGVALFTSLFVVFAWMVLFDSYFRRRFVSTKSRSAENAGDEETQSLMGGTDGTNGAAFVAGEEVGETPEISRKRHRSIVSGAGSTGGSALDALLSAAAVAEAEAEAVGIAEADRAENAAAVLQLEESPHHSATGAGSAGGAGNPPAASYLRNLWTGFEVHCSEASSILTLTQMSIVASFLTPSNALKTWQLTYSLRQHGASLSTLLALNSRKTRSGQRMLVPCLVIIEDSWGYVFGGFLSPTIQNKTSYYGNGESFVFSVLPTPRAYKWTGRNELFALSNPHCLAMGGGGDGYAWQLDDELDTGVSCRSDTYDNAQLSSSEFFKCLNIEVWALDAGFSV